MRNDLDDDGIIDGIRSATAAWNAPQTTAYYAERFGYNLGGLEVRLGNLAAAGLLRKHKRRDFGRWISTWTVGDVT
jgi:hypothetical protein